MLRSRLQKEWTYKTVRRYILSPVPATGSIGISHHSCYYYRSSQKTEQNLRKNILSLRISIYLCYRCNFIHKSERFEGTSRSSCEQGHLRMWPVASRGALPARAVTGERVKPGDAQEGSSGASMRVCRCARRLAPSPLLWKSLLWYYKPQELKDF